MSSAPILLTSLNAMGRLIFDYVHLLKPFAIWGLHPFQQYFSQIRAMGEWTQKIEGRSGSVR